MQVGRLWAELGADLSVFDRAIDGAVSNFRSAGQRIQVVADRIDRTVAGVGARLQSIQRPEGFESFEFQGLDQLDRKLGDVNKRLLTAGGIMTAAITVPTALLGVSATRAAADMEALILALDAVTGSSAETARQLENLKEIAKLPGLGFREAIQGSVRLQNVGFAARDAERVLAGFGKAVARTGGGRFELDRVTFQLTQLISKGKVLTQDLRPIMEAAPAVGKALRDAFGTVDAQQIEELGLTTEQFLDRLLTELEKMPPVAGKAKNAFENFGDASLRARAAVGNAFLPVVTAATDAITALLAVIELIPTPILAVGAAFAGLAAAAGPVLLAIGAFNLLLPSIQAGLAAIMPFVLAAAPWLALAVAVGAVAAAFGILHQNAKKAAAAQREFNAAEKAAAAQRIADRMTGATLQSHLALLGQLRRRERDIKQGFSGLRVGSEAFQDQEESLRRVRAEIEAAEGALVRFFDTADRSELVRGAIDMQRLGKAIENVSDEIADTQLALRFETDAEKSEKLQERLEALRQRLQAMRREYAAFDRMQALFARVGLPEIDRQLRMREQPGLITDQVIDEQFRRQVTGGPPIEIPGMRPVVTEVIVDGGQIGDTAMISDFEAMLVRLELAGRSAADALAKFALGALKQVGQTLLELFDPRRIAATMLDEALRSATRSLETLKGPVERIAAVVGAVLAPIVEMVADTLEKLTPVISAVVRVFGSLIMALSPVLEALVPLLEGMFPIFKALAIAATYLGQVFGIVGGAIAHIVGGIATVVGGAIAAIGKLIDRLPFVSGDAIIDAGNNIKAFGKGLRDAGDDLFDMWDTMAEARRDIEEIDIGDPLSELADAAREVTEELLNVPHGFKVALARFEATQGVPMGSAAASAMQQLDAAATGTTIGPVYVEATDARDFYAQLEVIAREKNVLLTGTTLGRTV